MSTSVLVVDHDKVVGIWMVFKAPSLPATSNPLATPLQTLTSPPSLPPKTTFPLPPHTLHPSNHLPPTAPIPPPLPNWSSGGMLLNILVEFFE